ncbi:mini-chromosome maintenance complex-binding protein-like [Haliotis rufescens]|uniref:mini-chromosome maintenance complex-binding protein-like n=1 Tax=Haliotis rufescens TaxID=6454 RepID=UPI00201EBFFF|nr:mini-chromosome maintenance complex-binding protein-like [Haliotis rufescens]
MPGVEDWTDNPLDVIQNLVDQHGISDNTAIRDYFGKRLQHKKALAMIPSLNNVALHNLRPNSLVKYRCMIQDMFDPEFYLGAYEVTDMKSKQTQMLSGKYKDIADARTHQEVNIESGRNVTMDRQTLYCVPVPGESDWVKAGYASQNVQTPGASTSNPHGRSKRGRDEDRDQGVADVSDQPMNDIDANEAGAANGGVAPSDTEPKRNRTAPSAGAAQSSSVDLNYPLPGETGLACLVKIYDDIDSFKVNDSVEFIGILSVDPSMAQFNVKPEGMEEVHPEFETEAERNAHAPPPSLVPRLHAILSRKLAHNNPHLPPVITDPDFVQALTTVQSEISRIRSELLSILEHAVFGDSLSAEYLLCHLISSVYNRADMMPLGKMSLNISGCPAPSRDYSQLVHCLVSGLVTQSHLFPLTIENMNQLKLSPAKDYSANRLRSGLLQLSDATQLIVDETMLQPGQLNPDGLKNITALGNLIKWAKVEYDFNYHTQEFPTNVNVLVLSEGESLLPKDCHTKLEKRQNPDDLRSYFSQLDARLTDELLGKLRVYFTLTKQLEYSISDDLQKLIQDDFVTTRKDNPKCMTVDNFHSLLSLVRLLTLSHCQTCPTLDLWTRAKQLETERRQRVGPPRTTPV